ncbi:hypothetical protein H0H93_002279 [Arthromyces matolae]|nr:hypothetical protein H0H93_002279 [Arthromyces matolae]
MKMFQSHPYNTSNTIEIITPPQPAALYTIYYRASTANDPTKDDTVDPSGHPLFIEYIIDYDQPKSRNFRYSVQTIKATSSHPVRNTKKELITGNHTLWESTNPKKYNDGEGSLQPNVFKYKFGSSIANAASLKVTIQPLDAELSGAKAILTGNVGGKVVFQGDFTFKGLSQSVEVDVQLVSPKISQKPFVLKGDVDWVVTLKTSSVPLLRQGNGVSRVELYFVAEDRHPAFTDAIPISFLRLVVKSASAKSQSSSVAVTRSPSLGDTARFVFADMEKRYDTVSGAANFNVTYWGGNFALNRYIAPDGPNAGRTYPKVNCMDQAAMFELSASVERLTGWLYLRPFGWINSTNIVGVKVNNQLIQCNNPFFEAFYPPAPAVVTDPYDSRRTPFGMHVFNCHSRAWDPHGDDGIYDACGGPSEGTDTIQQYLTRVIDHTQWWYTQYGPQYGHLDQPGTYQEVAHGYGIDILNGPSIYNPGHDNSPLPELISSLIASSTANTGHPLPHVGWARLPTWLKSTLGDSWEVQYEEIAVGQTITQAFWRISDANTPDDSITLQVEVFTVTTPDGHLNLELSTASLKDRVSDILVSTQRTDTWTSGNLPGHGAFLKYADHLPEGRIILATGNVLMDISGLASTEALIPHAVKLFDKTARRDNSPPLVPVLRQHGVVIRGSRPSSFTATQEGTITVTGIDARFYVVFKVDREIITARARCKGMGVLFDQYAVRESDDGDGYDVVFFFVTHQIGRHDVRACVAEVEGMVSVYADLVVEVVDA